MCGVGVWVWVWAAPLSLLLLRHLCVSVCFCTVMVVPRRWVAPLLSSFVDVDVVGLCWYIFKDVSMTFGVCWARLLCVEPRMLVV